MSPAGRCVSLWMRGSWRPRWSSPRWSNLAAGCSQPHPHTGNNTPCWAAVRPGGRVPPHPLQVLINGLYVFRCADNVADPSMASPPAASRGCQTAAAVMEVVPLGRGSPAEPLDKLLLLQPHTSSPTADDESRSGTATTVTATSCRVSIAQRPHPLPTPSPFYPQIHCQLLLLLVPLNLSDLEKKTVITNL